MTKQPTPKESESAPEVTSNMSSSKQPNDKAWGELANDSVGFIVCLLAAHYIMTYEIGTWRPGKMNVVYMFIAVGFGFDAYLRIRAGTAIAMSMGLVAGLISVAGMSGTTWFISGSEVFGGRQERIDFLVSTTAIMLAYANGNALGAVLAQLIPEAFEGNSNALTDVLKNIVISFWSLVSQKSIRKLDVLKLVINGLSAVILAIGLLWIAVKGLFGAD